MFNIILVGFGGFAGSISRYLIYLLVNTHLAPSFPISTLIVNSIGCFAISILTTIAEISITGLHPQLTLFLSTGFIGGFTTFSAFGFETAELLRSQPTLALLNIIGNLTIGVGAIIIGRFLATSLLT